MLLANFSQRNSSPGRAIGGTPNLVSNYKASSFYSFYTPDTTEASQLSSSSFPAATEPPYSWVLAPKGGQLSSTTWVGGSGATAIALSMGQTMECSLSGAGDASGSMTLLTSLAAALTGSGSVSSSVSLVLSMSADLSGSGGLNVSMGILLPLAADLVGSSTLTADLKGNADLACHIYVNSGTATVDEIVAGVWNALAADYDTSGTMGQKLNAAGTAGDPWTADLTSYAAGTAGKKLRDGLTKVGFISLK